VRVRAAFAGCVRTIDHAELVQTGLDAATDECFRWRREV